MVKPYDESMKKFVGANIYLINDGTIEESPLLWEL